MADILIRGMEMPQRCRDCCFAGFVFTCHLAGKTHDDVLRTRPDWCPLLPLPEGHGRLIDGDALLLDSGEVFEVCGDGFTISGFSREQIENAPTIVPAEGGGEDGN